MLPWQHVVLHRCPIFSLPDALQTNFEREANLFAAECTFFVGRFVEEVGSRAFHLSSALALREDYGASFEATFRHYVECRPAACLLLVSRLVSLDGGEHGALWEIRQFIASPTTTLPGQVGERFSLLELSALVCANGLLPGIVEHEVVEGRLANRRCYRAQSFWNTYKLFTLVWL